MRALNARHIVLITKKKNSIALDNFRPISLCNTLYKNNLKLILTCQSIIICLANADVPSISIYLHRLKYIKLIWCSEFHNLAESYYQVTILHLIWSDHRIKYLKLQTENRGTTYKKFRSSYTTTLYGNFKSTDTTFYELDKTSKWKGLDLHKTEIWKSDQQIKSPVAITYLLLLKEKLHKLQCFYEARNAKH